MTYRFRPGEPVAEGVRRIVVEEIDQAILDVRGECGDLDKGVHEARKRFKKIRAALRLVRRQLGEEIFERENRFFRDAGRSLSAARDAGAMVETFDKLAARFPELFDRPGVASVRDLLVRRREAQTGEREAFERLASEVERGLQEARSRAMEWNLGAKGFDAIGAGLRSIYRDTRGAFARAYDDPTPENFHEFRKRTKDHWYHVRLLRNLWVEMLDPLAASLKTLSELLGDDHDLVVLRTIVDEPSNGLDPVGADAVREGAERRHEELRRDARPLARRLLAERPRAFRARMRAFWEASEGGGSGPAGSSGGAPSFDRREIELPARGRGIDDRLAPAEGRGDRVEP